MCFLWWRYILVKNVFPIGDKGYCLGRKFFFQKAAMVIFSSNNVRQKNEELQESSSFYFAVEEINHELLDPEKVNPRLYSLRDSMENSIRSPLFPLRFLMDGGLGNVFLLHWFIDATYISWVVLSGTVVIVENSVASKAEICLLLEI